MPEGPSLVLLKEKLKPFEKKKLTDTGGYATAPHAVFKGQRLQQIDTHGKHLLLQFKEGFISIHLMLFGSMTLNEPKQVNPSIFFRFGKDTVYFYVVKVNWEKGKIDAFFDWSTDIMHNSWNPKKVLELLKQASNKQIGDVLLNQELFTGVGNIIRTEALYRARIHPSSMVGKIPDKKMKSLLTALRQYSKEFLRDRKKDQLEKNFKVYKQKICSRDGHTVTHREIGKTKRKMYYCTQCQTKFS